MANFGVPEKKTSWGHRECTVPRPTTWRCVVISGTDGGTTGLSATAP